MKINSNSWHFRLWVFSKRVFKGWDDEYLKHKIQSLNLCRYFWSVIGAMLRFSFWGLVQFPVANMFGARWDGGFFRMKYPRQAIYTGIVIFLMPTILGLITANTIWMGISEYLFNMLLVMSVLTVIFAGGVSISENKQIIKDTMKNKIESSFLHVVVEFLRAKKLKVCPKIEVEF